MAAIIGLVAIFVAIVAALWFTRGGKYVPDELNRRSERATRKLGRGEAFEDPPDDDY